MILLALKLLCDQVYNNSHTAAVLKAKENSNKKESVCPQSAISLQLNAVKLEIKCNVFVLTRQTTVINHPKLLNCCSQHRQKVPVGNSIQSSPRTS